MYRIIKEIVSAKQKKIEVSIILIYPLKSAIKYSIDKEKLKLILFYDSRLADVTIGTNVC